MQALRELLALFDIKVQSGELVAADRSVEAFRKKLGHVSKEIAEAFAVYEVYEFIKSQVELNSHLQDLASRLDVSANALRSFSMVAQDAGVDQETAANSIGLLQKNLGEAALKGGAAAEAFAKLGVGLKGANGEARPMNEVLGDVAEGMAALPDQNQRAAMAMTLFGRAGRSLVPILSQGREGLQAALEEADALGDGLGDKFYSDVKKAADGFEHFSYGLQSLKNRALAAILPAIASLGEWLQSIAKDLLEFDKRTHALSSGLVALSSIFGVMMVRALIGVTAHLGFLKVALAEWALPIAAISGLVWVVQDLWKLMTTGTSVIGDLVDRLEGVGASKRWIAQLREMWKSLTDVINASAYAAGFFVGAVEGVFGIAAPDSNEIAEFFLEIIKLCMAATRLVTGFFGMFGHGLAAAGATIGSMISGDYLESGSPTADREWELAGKSADRAGDATFGRGGILGDWGVGQVSTDVTDYGVDPGSLAANRPKRPSRRKGEVTGGARHGGVQMTGGARKGTVQLFSPAEQAAAAAANVSLATTNNITIHTASEKPTELANAAANGVTGAGRKELNAALLAANVK